MHEGKKRKEKHEGKSITERRVGRKIVKMTLLWRKITFLIDVAIAILALAKGDEADRVEISMLSFAGIAHTIRNQSDIFNLMFFFYLYIYISLSTYILKVVRRKASGTCKIKISK